MTDLHNEDGKGITGFQAVLDKYLTGDKAMDVVHDWAAMVALDKAIDDGAKLLGFAARVALPDEDAQLVDLLGEPGVVFVAGCSAERFGLRPAP